MDSGLELVKYRDAGMSTYTYFWWNEEYHRVLSPYFDSEQDANDWLGQQYNSVKLRNAL
jgi:hypothetical protein